jgi:hypothetical protein
MSNEWTTLNPGSNGDAMDEEGVSYGSAPLVRKRPRVVIAGSTEAEVIKPLASAPVGTEYAVPVRQVGSMPSLPAGSNLIGQVTLTELAADLCVTIQGSPNTLTTLTLPLVSGKYHYIHVLELVLFNSGARTGVASPLVISTTTNLPGSLSFIWPTAGAIGTIEQKNFQPGVPLKSSAAGTATTIVGPAIANIAWRFTAWYRAAP